MPDPTKKEMGRRSFITKAVISIITISGSLIALMGFLIPIPKTGRHSRRHKIGRFEDYPVNRFTFLEKEKIFILREREGVRAVSAICTHLGCVLKENSHKFVCPCHGSRYDNIGHVLSGPAPKDLNWYQISQAPDGKMLVHLDKTVDYRTRFLTQKTNPFS